jgi:hypothetical protein
MQQALHLSKTYVSSLAQAWVGSLKASSQKTVSFDAAVSADPVCLEPRELTALPYQGIDRHHRPIDLRPSECSNDGEQSTIFRETGQIALAHAVITFG